MMLISNGLWLWRKETRQGKLEACEYDLGIKSKRFWFWERNYVPNIRFLLFEGFVFCGEPKNTKEIKQ